MGKIRRPLRDPYFSCQGQGNCPPGALEGGHEVVCLREVAHTFKTRVKYYRAIYHHPQTPWLAKALLWAALAYAVTPVDLIPDFIPVLGHLDDLLIVPGLILAAVWMVPASVLEECEDAVRMSPE